MTAAIDGSGVFDGPAELDVAGQRCAIRVRLAGHLNPIDGQYHWQGLAYGAPDGVVAGAQARLTIGSRTAPVRLVEKVSSGQIMICGVGAPPYEIPSV